MSANTHGSTPYYYVPAPSRHPAMAALGLFFIILGAGQWVNDHDWGKYSLVLGLIIWLATPSMKACTASTASASTARSAGA